MRFKELHVGALFRFVDLPDLARDTELESGLEVPWSERIFQKDSVRCYSPYTNPFSHSWAERNAHMFWGGGKRRNAIDSINRQVIQVRYES